jgi:hypothetical protein
MSFEVQNAKKKKKRRKIFSYYLISIDTSILGANYLKGRICMCTGVSAGQHGGAWKGSHCDMELASQ